MKKQLISNSFKLLNEVELLRYHWQLSEMPAQ